MLLVVEHCKHTQQSLTEEAPVGSEQLVLWLQIQSHKGGYFFSDIVLERACLPSSLPCSSCRHFQWVWK